jgi:hypothetical protein
MLDCFLPQIQRVYETYNIYQSIIGCPQEEAGDLVDRLLKDDYPVVLWDQGCQKFIDMQARAIVIPFEVLVDEINASALKSILGHVNIVISLGEETMDWVIRDMCNEHTQWVLL